VTASKLDHALALAKRGFKVFPLIEGGKLPAIQNYPAKATTDADAIARWFGADPVTGWEKDLNIGVLTGGDLAVLDVDNKNGVDGNDSLDRLTIVEDLPSTFQVETPSGGRHLYFRVSAETRNSAAKLGPGLDVRGRHGFVVAPGSTIDGKPYQAESDAPVAPAPQWLEAMFSKATPKEHSDSTAKIDLDTLDAIARATEFLTTAEPAIEGAGGDHYTFRIAARVKDFGISEAKALDLLLSHWNDRCSPPWQPDDLESKIRNAYAYGDRPIGIASPQMDFEPVTIDQGRKLYLELFQDITADVDTPYLIENYLDQHAFSVIYGESHTGKTFVALDMSFHIAAGRPWCDQPVMQGGVVYVAAEGGRGIRKRIAALRKHFGAASVPLAIVPCSVNLLGGSRSDVDALIKLIDQAALAMGGPVAMVVIDTLSRAMAGANENASEDMTSFVAACDRIRAASGAHVMVVHHAGKDTAKGARGHSSLRAATDTEIEVADNTVQVRKQRDGEHMEMRRFALRTMEVGKGRGGKPVTSCVVTWAGAGEDFLDVALTPDEQRCLDALTAARGESEAAVPTAEVAAAYPLVGFPEVSVKTVQRALASLSQKGVVLRSGNGRWTGWTHVVK
jgi:hypothetical protein